MEVVQEIKLFNLDDTKQLTWSGYKWANFFTLLEPCKEISQATWYITINIYYITTFITIPRSLGILKPVQFPGARK